MSADLDRQIDRAVREMLDVEPRADLRARVMAQLPASSSRLPAFAEATAGRPAAGFRLPASGWVLGAIAAAAVLLMVVRLSWHAPAPITPAVVAHVEPQSPAPLVVPPAPQRVESAARVGTRVRRVNTPDAPVFATSAEDPGTATADITPLNAIAPITVAPVAQGSIAPEQLAMRPLNPIADLQVAPLSPPDRRN